MENVSGGTLFRSQAFHFFMIMYWNISFQLISVLNLQVSIQNKKKYKELWNIFDNLSSEENLFLQTMKLILDKSSAKIWTELALFGLMDQLILHSQLHSN